ncbi:MAG: hypothetical protein LBN33_03015 [Desulfovibrio sp.]|jgi:hypothetical protein|nr:hypothetical protein [Desulfovibrio sp.]
MWIITKDLISDCVPDGTSRVGVHSADYDAERFAVLPTLPVRVLDDDGEVYYEGRATRERILDSYEDRAFDFLDWAMADAGCTELQYKEGRGSWETL